MPIKITLPNLSKRGRASDLSSRKLLDIAVHPYTSQHGIEAASAVSELKQRKHYLRELKAEGLLRER